MSGGCYDYGYYQLENYIGHTKDIEIDDLLKDLQELLHDLEWCDSGDIGEEDYFEKLTEFKNKWFKQSRNKRLKTYVNDEIIKLKNDLYKMIGEEENE